MSRTKPVTAEEAISIVEKRRRQARAHYARMRDDARRYREARRNDESASATNEPTNTK